MALRPQLLLALALAFILTACVKQATPTPPETSTSEELVGDSYFQSGNFQKAIEHYDNAQRQGAKLSSVAYRKGFAFFAQDKWETALAQFKVAIQSDPKLAIAYEGAGMSAFQIGKVQEAVRYFERTRELAPKHWVPYAFLGAIYHVRGQKGLAKELHDKALELGGPNKRPLVIATLQDAYAKAVKIVPAEAEADTAQAEADTAQAEAKATETEAEPRPDESGVAEADISAPAVELDEDTDKPEETAEGLPEETAEASEDAAKADEMTTEPVAATAFLFGVQDGVAGKPVLSDKAEEPAEPLAAAGQQSGEASETASAADTPDTAKPEAEASAAQAPEPEKSEPAGTVAAAEPEKPAAQEPTVIPAAQEKPQTTPPTAEPEPARQEAKAETETGQGTVPAPPPGEARFSILESSWQNKNKAEARLADLRKMGLSAYTTQINLGSRGIWHRVLFGPFEDLATARSAKERIAKAHGLEDMLILKQR